MEATPPQLRLAGRLAILSAIIGIPGFALQIYLEGEGGSTYHVISAMLSVGTLALYIYLLLTLRSLLWAKYDFHGVDALVHVMIAINVLVVAMGELPDAMFDTTAGFVISMGAVMVLGVLLIIFGVRLLRLDGDLYGLRKPYCYACMAMGACLAFPWFFVIGLLISVAADVMLALIFFRAARA